MKLAQYSALALLLFSAPALAKSEYNLHGVQCTFSNGVTLRTTEKSQFSDDVMGVSTKWGFLSRNGAIRAWGLGITNRKEYNAEFMLEMEKIGQPERDTFFLFVNLDLENPAAQQATGQLRGESAERKVADAECTIELSRNK